MSEKVIHPRGAAERTETRDAILLRPTIAIFTGPSGGHLFPAVAFAEELLGRFPAGRIDLVTGERARSYEKGIPPGIFTRIYYRPEFPFPPVFSLRIFGFLLKLLGAFRDAWRYLKQTKPDVCVGFGSYASYPGMRLSVFLKIPTLIHEQNRIPGKATRWLAPHVDAVAVSFADTLGDLTGKETRVVGFPLRPSFVSAWHKDLREPEKGLRTSDTFHILVIGGSQGAHRLNELVTGALGRLTDEEKQKIAVNHITGTRDLDWVSGAYRKIGIGHEVYAFYDSIDELYQRADMAITRGGSGTLFELALFKLPAIIIPYPHASKHQTANAEFFASQKALLLEAEDKLDAGILIERIRALRDQESLRRCLSEGMERLAAPDAAKRLAAFLEDTLTRRKKSESRL